MQRHFWNSLFWNLVHLCSFWCCFCSRPLFISEPGLQYIRHLWENVTLFLFSIVSRRTCHHTMWYHLLESALKAVLHCLSHTHKFTHLYHVWIHAQTSLESCVFICCPFTVSLTKTWQRCYNRHTKRFKFLSYPPVNTHTLKHTQTYTATHIHKNTVFCSTTVKFHKHYFGVSGLRRIEMGPDCRKQPQWINACGRAAPREVIKSEIWTRALLMK